MDSKRPTGRAFAASPDARRGVKQAIFRAMQAWSGNARDKAGRLAGSGAALLLLAAVLSGALLAQPAVAQDGMESFTASPEAAASSADTSEDGNDDAIDSDGDGEPDDPAAAAAEAADDIADETGDAMKEAAEGIAGAFGADLDEESENSVQNAIRDALPKVFSDELMGIEIWQWVGLFLIIFIGVIVDYSFRLIVKIVSARFARRDEEKAEKQTVAYAARPVGLFAASIVWIVLLHVLALLGLPDVVTIILLTAAQFFAVLTGTWAAWRLTDLVAEILARRAEKTSNKFDDVLIPLIRRAVKIFIFVFGVIYGAKAVNIDIAPLLAGLGIGGLAFAFAAKDTIENFFGSIAVLLDRPFQVGDWVVVDGTEGTVEEIGFRSTRIRTFYNSQVTMPNASLVRAVVDNYGRRQYRRFKCHLNVQYDTPPDLIVAFAEGIREIVRNHPYTRKDYYHVYLNEFGAHSLDVLVYIFFEVPDWQTELRERERFMLDVVRIADQLGVEFAFPTQTIHLYKEEKDQPHLPGDMPGDSTEQRASSMGIAAAQKLMANQAWLREKPEPHHISDKPTSLSAEAAQEFEKLREKQLKQAKRKAGEEGEQEVDDDGRIRGSADDKPYADGDDADNAQRSNRQALTDDEVKARHKKRGSTADDASSRGDSDDGDSGGDGDGGDGGGSR